MAGSKEIRNKIKSVQSTRKITKAMEMVAASKMKKAQDRMRASRPYVLRALQIAMHVAKANTEYKHPFLARRETVKRVGAIVVTTDKGLCGGLNTNMLRLVLQQHKEWRAKGIEVDYCRRSAARDWASSAASAPTSCRSVVQLGDRPHLDKLVGPVKVLLDKYVEGTVDEVHVFFTIFVNTMKQEARHGGCCRSPSSSGRSTGEVRTASRAGGHRGTTSTSPTRRRCSTACCGATSRRSSSRW